MTGSRFPITYLATDHSGTAFGTLDDDTPRDITWILDPTLQKTYYVMYFLDTVLHEYSELEKLNCKKIDISADDYLAQKDTHTLLEAEARSRGESFPHTVAIVGRESSDVYQSSLPSLPSVDYRMTTVRGPAKSQMFAELEKLAEEQGDKRPVEVRRQNTFVFEDRIPAIRHAESLNYRTCYVHNPWTGYVEHLRITRRTLEHQFKIQPIEDKTHDYPRYLVLNTSILLQTKPIDDCLPTDAIISTQEEAKCHLVIPQGKKISECLIQLQKLGYALIETGYQNEKEVVDKYSMIQIPDWTKPPNAFAFPRKHEEEKTSSLPARLSAAGHPNAPIIYYRESRAALYKTVLEHLKFEFKSERERMLVIEGTDIHVKIASELGMKTVLAGGNHDGLVKALENEINERKLDLQQREEELKAKKQRVQAALTSSAGVKSFGVFAASNSDSTVAPASTSSAKLTPS